MNKVFSFGISNDCDKHLIQSAAEAGNGSSTIVDNYEMSELKERVIAALKRASQPSLSNCQFSFGCQIQNDRKIIDPSQPVFLNELYRNELVRCFSIMTEDEFKKGIGDLFK